MCLDLDARPLLHMWVGKHDHELQGNRTHLGHLNGEVRCCWRCAAGCGGDNSQRLCSRGRCGLLRLRIRRVVQGSITAFPGLWLPPCPSRTPCPLRAFAASRLSSPFRAVCSLFSNSRVFRATCSFSKIPQSLSSGLLVILKTSSLVRLVRSLFSNSLVSCQRFALYSVSFERLAPCSQTNI